MLRRPTIRIVTASLAVLAIGCGTGDRPSLGRVTGTVMLDGSAVEGALVTFRQEGFRAAQGLSDSTGKYEVRYIRDIMGAPVGDCEVSVRDNTNKKRWPDSYAEADAFSKTVEGGTNEINFELSSSGL